MTGAIPSSSALSEAHTDSLTELLSRDPESYQQQDLDRIIGLMREQRVRWEAAEGTKATKPRASAKAVLGTKIEGATLDELDL